MSCISKKKKTSILGNTCVSIVFFHYLCVGFGYLDFSLEGLFIPELMKNILFHVVCYDFAT